MSKPSPARQPDQNEGPAGSPPFGEPVFLVVAKLRRPHGLGGEILTEVITDFPERLVPGVKVYVGEAYRLEQIRSCRTHAKGLLLAFENYQF